jgi:hypothetical protein
MPLKAQLISLNTHLTPLGKRIYAVFQIPDGHQLGLWLPADHPDLGKSKAGDYHFFERNIQGTLHLVAPTIQRRVLNLIDSLNILKKTV